MQQRMSKRAAERAWELLCRNRVAVALRKLIRKMAASTAPAHEALLFGDHEFSFESTPLVHVSMHRAPSALRFKLPRPRLHIPCITPHPHCDQDKDDQMWRDHDYFFNEAEAQTQTHDEGIDERAQQFITNFYQEMKQQRQISISYV